MQTQHKETAPLPPYSWSRRGERPWWADEGHVEPYFVGTVINEPTLGFLKGVNVHEDYSGDLAGPNWKDRIYYYRGFFIVAACRGPNKYRYRVVAQNADRLCGTGVSWPLEEALKLAASIIEDLENRVKDPILGLRSQIMISIESQIVGD